MFAEIQKLAFNLIFRNLAAHRQFGPPVPRFRRRYAILLCQGRNHCPARPTGPITMIDLFVIQEKPWVEQTNVIQNAAPDLGNSNRAPSRTRAPSRGPNQDRRQGASAEKTTAAATGRACSRRQRDSTVSENSGKKAGAFRPPPTNLDPKNSVAGVGIHESNGFR